MTWIWLGVTLLAIVAELFTTELISIWFVGGGIVAIILSFFEGIGWQWQLLAFVLVTELILTFLRPVVKKYFTKNNDGNTNIEALKSQKVRMLSAATFDQLGTVKINGIVWSVKSQNGETLEEGSIVKIVEISGTKLIVKKCDDSTSTTVS